MGLFDWLYRKKIKLNPDYADRIICSRCGKEFVSRGISDMAFAYIKRGAPVYVPRPNVLCYECEENDKREKAKDNYIGGPLDNKEGYHG